MSNYNTKVLSKKEIAKIDAWFKDNITLDGSWISFKKIERRTRYTYSRKGVYRTNHYNITEDIKVPFKARSLAAYLQFKRPDLTVKCSPWSMSKERGSMTSPIALSRGHYEGYRIEVTNPNDVIEQIRGFNNKVMEPRILFDHITCETYRTNNEIAEFIAKAINGLKLERTW